MAPFLIGNLQLLNNITSVCGLHMYDYCTPGYICSNYILRSFPALVYVPYFHIEIFNFLLLLQCNYDRMSMVYVTFIIVMEIIIINFLIFTRGCISYKWLFFLALYHCDWFVTSCNLFPLFLHQLYLQFCFPNYL